MTDIIGGAHMQKVSNTTFTSDRFGNPNSALNLNGGYTVVPAGVYFNSPFSITLWVNPYLNESWARLIDFSNGYAVDNIALLPCKGVSNTPFFLGGTANWAFRSTSSLLLNNSQWYFLTATYDGSEARIYVDNILVASANSVYNFQPYNVMRSTNYIGKSAQAGNGYSFSYLDDLKFYNICLTLIQINMIMNQVNSTTTTALTNTTNSSIFFKLKYPIKLEIISKVLTA